VQDNARGIMNTCGATTFSIACKNEGHQMGSLGWFDVDQFWGSVAHREVKKLTTPRQNAFIRGMNVRQKVQKHLSRNKTY